jgi:hypothetical protein
VGEGGQRLDADPRCQRRLHLSQVLLGSGVDQEVAFKVAGQARIAVVERILNAA